jgi:hypothetical protein
MIIIIIIITTSDAKQNLQSKICGWRRHPLFSSHNQEGLILAVFTFLVFFGLVSSGES